MTKHRGFTASRRFADQLPGEIATCRVLNPLENRYTEGKARPAVLIRRDGCRWLVMGLTTRSTFANGAKRRPVKNPSACGLGVSASFLWGRPTWVSALDVGDHIGHADDDLLASVVALSAGTHPVVTHH
jgi:hypothetical protein